MKKTIILAVAAVLVTGAFAQNPKGSFSVRPLAGINVTGFSGGKLGDMYHTKVRLAAGLEGEYAANEWLGLSLGVIYSQQGAKIDGGVMTLASDYAGQYNVLVHETGKLHCDYLNFPLLANIYVPAVRGLAVKLGVQVGLLVNDRITATVEALKIPVIPTPSDHLVLRETDGTEYMVTEASLSDVCKSVDFGIPIGLSYEYKNVVLDARYYFGLTKVDKTDDPDNVRNRCLSVTLGYRFHL